ncbi:MAG TPA: glycosyltransferase family 39 protein [Anaerolineae bacterium]|nr:glycosyltransferase family 39 protein [Anaerolineae bacterium]
MTFGVLLLIFLLGMGLRLHQLDADSLWLDEVHTAITSRLDFVSMLNFLVEEDVHPPLHYLLTHWLIAFLGTSDFLIRLPSALFGSASVVLAYKLGELLWTRKEGLVGAFILAVNTYLVHYSQEARHYALMVFFVLFSLIFLILAVRHGRIGSWLGFAMCTSLAIYTHYFSFLVLPSQVAFAMWMIWKKRPPTVAEEQSPPPHPRRQTLALLASLLLVAASYLPWLPAMRAQLLKPDIGLQGFGSVPESAAHLSLGFFRDLLADYTGWDGVPLLLLLALFMIGLSRCRREHLLLFGLWIVTPFVFLAVVQAKHFFDVRYTIFILPLCLLLVGRGTSASAAWLGRPLGHRTGQRHTSSVLLSSFAILLGLLNVAPLRDYYTHQKEDWRGTARYLAANLVPGDGIIGDSTLYGTGSDADRVTKSLPYYLDAYGVTGNPVFRVRQGLWKQLTEWDHWNGRLWAVLWHPQRDLDEASTAQAVEFPGVSVVRLREPSGDALLDTERLLRLLLGLIPEGSARFDVHLTLANIYIRTGRLEHAKSELQLASELMPDHPTASASLEKELARCGRLSQALDGMRYPLWRNFGNEVALLGYAFAPDTAQPGDTLELTAWWYPMQEMERDYTAFVHVLDLDGSVRAQQDKLLRRGRRTTSHWKPEEVVTVKYEMLLPADAPPGLYTINVGVYYWETAERLSARDESGQRLSGDMVRLHQIEVKHQND